MLGASRSSQIPELQKNADGSIDIYFGPTAPAGKGSNWVPTDAARTFELMFRAYAPTKALFERRPGSFRTSKRSRRSRRRGGTRVPGPAAAARDADASRLARPGEAVATREPERLLQEQE